MPRPPVRSRCGPHHLAFFRGVVLDGLDPIALAKRYLPIRPLPRVVHGHLRWIRDELINTARRLETFHFARLLQRPLPVAPPSSTGPTLEQFAAQFPDGFYSEAELGKLVRAAYPELPAVRTARRRRAWAVKRLRQAIGVLERASVVGPQPTDPVEAWLARALPTRCARPASARSPTWPAWSMRAARAGIRAPKLGPRRRP